MPAFSDWQYIVQNIQQFRQTSYRKSDGHSWADGCLVGLLTLAGLAGKLLEALQTVQPSDSLKLVVVQPTNNEWVKICRP